MPSMETELEASAGKLYLLKGEPATRKSTQALSFPKPQYWFSFDQKMDSLLIPMQNWKMNPKEIEFDNYNDWMKPQKKLEDLRLNCNYGSIVIDSVTTAVKSIMRQTKQLKVGTIRDSGKEAGLRIAGIQINELEDYKAEESALGELVSLCKDISEWKKIPVIFIAHVIRVEYKGKDGNTGNISRSIFTGAKKSAIIIPAECSEVYHFDVEGDMEVGKPPKYRIHTMHTGDDYARTTLRLPAIIEPGEKELYNEWIMPAIVKQREEGKLLVK